METTNKKQSSIDWLLSSNKQLYYDLHEGKIHQHEYHPKLKEIEQQAKQMHKDEIEVAYSESFRLRNKPYSTAKKYYNETFGGDNE